jgi:hypothetical protein
LRAAALRPRAPFVFAACFAAADRSAAVRREAARQVGIEGVADRAPDPGHLAALIQG